MLVFRCQHTCIVVLLRWVAPADFSRPGPLVSLVLSPPQASITSSDEPARSAVLQIDKPRLTLQIYDFSSISGCLIVLQYSYSCITFELTIDSQFHKHGLPSVQIQRLT